MEPASNDNSALIHGSAVLSTSSWCIPCVALPSADIQVCTRSVTLNAIVRPFPRGTRPSKSARMNFCGLSIRFRVMASGTDPAPARCTVDRASANSWWLPAWLPEVVDDGSASQAAPWTWRWNVALYTTRLGAKTMSNSSMSPRCRALVAKICFSFYSDM